MNTKTISYCVIVATAIMLAAVSAILCPLAVQAEGTVPKYEVSKTQEGNVTLPKYDVEAPKVDVSTEKKDVNVPKVGVYTEKETLTVPKVEITPAKDRDDKKSDKKVAEKK